MSIKVVKRDGSTETFLPEKIIRVLLAAGLEEDLALTVSSKVAAWAKSLKSKKIPTLKVRDRVISELQKVDPYIAGLYAWYQGTKDQMYDAPK